MRPSLATTLAATPYLADRTHSRGARQRDEVEEAEEVGADEVMARGLEFCKFEKQKKKHNQKSSSGLLALLRLARIISQSSLFRRCPRDPASTVRGPTSMSEAGGGMSDGESNGIAGEENGCSEGR